VLATIFCFITGTWTIFAISTAYLIGWKKDVIWLILGIIYVSLLIF